MMKILRSKRGEATYIETAIFIIVVVMFISLALNLFSVISMKQQMDVCADQLVRQIQYSGEVNANTDALFEMVCGNMNEIDNLRYSVDTTYCRGKKIQLGVPFQVVVRGKVYLGGFGNVGLFPLELVAKAAGVSEEFWK